MMFAGLRKHSLRKLIYYLRYTEFTALARIINQKLITPNFPFHRATPEKKFCLLISGCPGDPFRYRCEHQAAQLELLGFASDICYASQIDNHKLVDHYQWLWLHRVFNTERIEPLIDAAHRCDKSVFFDIDDFEFDEKTIPYMRATEWMSEREVERAHERAKGYSKIMARCDMITVPTEDLREAVVNIFPKKRCIVTQNMLNDTQLDLAAQALKSVQPNQKKNNGGVTIAYFSGTHTHNTDFRECAPALVRIMKAYPRVKLLLVGYLDLGQEFTDLRRQIEYRRLVRWERLPGLFSRVDINLAPLELDNPFTTCKSDLKYLEAAIMGVPTVASAVGSFTTSIKHGENGYLCQTSEEWFSCLSRLVEDSILRQRMGSVARQRVIDSRTIKQGAELFRETLLIPNHYDGRHEPKV